MKNLKKIKLFALVVIPLSIITVSCSAEDVNEAEPETLVSEEALSKTSGGSCGTKVNFKDLVVETSWISGSTGNRKTFDACGVDGEPWMDKYNSGVVMMKCLQGDGHRTELKEDVGDEAALNKYRKLKFTAKFTNLPQNGVTIAQIHNRGSNVKRPWIRVYIDSDRFIKIKETETNPTGSSSNYTTHTGIKYTSGQNITVNLWTGLSGQKKGKVHVVTGGNTWTKTVWPSSAWNSKSNSYYLKAGVYTEGNNKTCTVKYSSFSIRH